MVRVLTVHNFASQHIHTVEQPTASTIAPPHRLLSALSSHCIEVRDLKDEANLLFTFPTVDQVTKLIHCLNGDYVATLESKFNRQNREINYVRVYVNWDSIATLQQSKMTTSGASLDSSECGMVQPMRARIAGRVTPTTNQSEISNLEMIEIPVRQNPHNIECCQISGNILIQSSRFLTIYTFQIKTHDISKLKFIDFEELPIYLEINFIPLKIAFCENYISCLNKDTIHTFKMERKLQKGNEETKEPEYCDTNFKFVEEDVPIDYKELLKKESTNSTKDKITVNLPSIIKHNSLIYKHCPFIFIDKDMTATVHHNFNSEDVSFAYVYNVINLMQLKLKPLMIDNSQTQIFEEFRCLVLKPLYVDENLRKTVKVSGGSFLRSNFKDCLTSIVCFIATSQEGYLFQFCDSDINIDSDNCISVYPFMGPVYNVALEDHLLHALTETGLESYTVRIGHKLCRSLEVIDNINSACPQLDDLICLIGHKQFLSIEQFLLCDNYLVLLASADGSPTHSINSSNSSTSSNWTLYNLELPTPKMIFTDIAMAANAHRFTAPQTYCHLISEAHMILRLALILLKWNIREGNVCTIAPLKINIDDLVDTYRTSCALLGDHFIINSNDNYKLCLPYYKMACISPHEVLKRFKRIEYNRNDRSMNAILYYLTMILSDTKFKIANSKNEGNQNFIEELLDVFENHNCFDLAYLVLKNSMLREYSTSKFINILLQQSYSNVKKETEKLLALTLLYVQECNMKEAENVINMITDNQVLYQTLVENWKLLVESSHSMGGKHKSPYCFSEFSVTLMFTKCDVLSEVFVFLMFDRKIHLHNILRMFLEYLPSRVGSDGNTAATVMQKTLEQYFKNYFKNQDVKDLSKFANERPSSLQEAIKILVRSYLSELQMLHIKDLSLSEENLEKRNFDEKCEEDQKLENLTRNGIELKVFHHENAKKEKKHNKLNDILFNDLRHDYLNKMPPFQVNITSKLYETCVNNYVDKELFMPNKRSDLILHKLQALMCSRIVSRDILLEANTFIAVNDSLRGYSSLKSIMLDTDEAVTYLLEVCPQCLPQFGKDRFTTNNEWKNLIMIMQKKIVQLSKDLNLKRVCFYHKKLLKDILTHLATSMSVEQLHQVLPQQNLSVKLDETDFIKSEEKSSSAIIDNCDDIISEICCYEPYVTICRETMQANQIKKLITTTGQQLLLTLNL